MTATLRSVTLYGTLTGSIWMPGVEAQLPIVLDLKAEAARDVSRCGMVQAIRSAVDCAGDFRSAKLTADSFVIIERRKYGPPDGTVRTVARRVELAELPSLADYIATDVYTTYGDDE